MRFRELERIILDDGWVCLISEAIFLCELLILFLNRLD